MSDTKSNVWDIEARVILLYKRVCFDVPVDREEAVDRFLTGGYEEILDTEELAIEFVDPADAKPV